MIDRRSRFILLAVLLGAAALAGSGLEPSEGPVSTTIIDRGQITWQPTAGAGWLLVKVTGPGEYAFVAEFPPGQLPIFRALDPDGNPLPDGTYNYEIDQRPTNPRARAANDPQGLPTKSKGISPIYPTESGTFTVLNGSIVDPTVEEGTSKGKSSGVTTNAVTPDTGVSLQDQVIVDDLIVDGSICVGFDCVNGENFGFDTLRLKENNTRIKFDDTSNSGSFPFTDWQLTANDSSNGGANKFSIEDMTNSKVPFTIEAGSASNSLYVDSGKKVGFNTSTPVVELHSADGDTPTLRLEQNGTSGFTPQTWDIAGNETNFFVRDVTNGSQLPFKIRPGADDNSLVIDNDNDIGMGILSPTAALHLKRTNGSADVLIEEASSTTQDRVQFVLKNNGDPRMDFLDTSEDRTWRLGQDSGGFSIWHYSPGTGLFEQFLKIGSGGLVIVPRNLRVDGTLTKTAGSFKIDHPLDPANKYLSHSFVESPDMLNIYNGEIHLDEDGTAEISLPPWFEALNQNYRYQLTSINQPSPYLHISEGVKDNSFRIAGGVPGGVVSWQVTGVRHDLYAEEHRIPVEEMKPVAERGTFLYAGYYGNAAPKDFESQETAEFTSIDRVTALEMENRALKERLDAILQRLDSLEKELNSQSDRQK